MTIGIYYDDTSGEARVITDDKTVPFPPAPTGQTLATFGAVDAYIGDPIDLADWVWNPSTRNIEARPPKVVVDRWTDFRDHPHFTWFQTNIWAGLTAQQRTLFLQDLNYLLGLEFQRAEGEGIAIGYTAGDEP